MAALQVDGGTVRLLPAGSWDIHGKDPSPETWRYRLDLWAPSGNRTVRSPPTGAGAIASDLDNLTIADPSVNRSKGARDAAEWMPASHGAWFAQRVIAVKLEYPADGRSGGAGRAGEAAGRRRGAVELRQLKEPATVTPRPSIESCPCSMTPCCARRGVRRLPARGVETDLEAGCARRRRGQPLPDAVVPRPVGIT